MRGEQVIGYGLVVGLNGTGDSQRSTFTVQSVSSMLKRFGITVPQDQLRLRNVAAVIVTATIPAFTKEGGTVDVTVSSLGDATGLQGGTLLVTPLSGLNGAVYASAQGPISVGGMNVRSNGSEVRRNHTAAGRVPGGAMIEKPVDVKIYDEWKVSVVLWQPDFTTAMRIVSAVNTKLGVQIASAVDASTIALNVPNAVSRQREDHRFHLAGGTARDRSRCRGESGHQREDRNGRRRRQCDDPSRRDLACRTQYRDTAVTGHLPAAGVLQRDDRHDSRFFHFCRTGQQCSRCDQRCRNGAGDRKSIEFIEGIAA
jgi:hypothetical protein